MELSSLIFTAKTDDLERASKVIQGLVTDVSKLDKASRDAAKTEEILAKAAKSNADANLQNAKAQDVRLKSTITADKADKANEESITKKTKAIEKETEATTKSVGVLQRQTDILEFQTKGFSKGQSSILAYGKAAGLAVADMESLAKVLETQRKLMGGDPFDKSSSGLKSLQNQYTELKESVRQYNTDSDLTAKQARELARDKERLIEKMKVEGASFSDIRTAVRAHNQEYVNLAAQYNKLSSAEDAVVKGRREAVAATNYLTQADEKMSAALNVSNKAFDKAGTDSLVKYETALRKSGVSQDVATQRLAKYRVQLEQVQKAEAARSEQFLARALMPQATDVAVSLWSGQNPLTVLLQQGGQAVDLFNQSGVAAEKFGETVKKSMAAMLPSILVVVKGVGGLIVDGFVAAGNAVVNFIGKVTGMNTVLEMGNKKLQALGFGRVAEGLKDIGGLLTGVAAVGVAALITALVSLGIAFKNALKEGAELSRSLELTGASLALTKSAAIDLAQSLATSERPVASVVSVINELAKAGKFSSENIALVTNAAIDLERYGKVAIADTAKELSKLREDPVKALVEVAEKTGYVNLETIETVKSLREQGKMAEAAELAMKAWATSSTSAATSIKNQMSPLEQVWDSILSKINQVIGRLQDLARGSGLAEQIADKEAQLASVKGGFFTSTFGLSPKGAKDVDRLSEEIYMLKLQLQAETDITKERAKRSSAAAQLKAETDATKEYTTAIEKQAGKEATLSEFVKKALEERTRSVASALSKNIEDVKLSADTTDKITKGAELQWKEMQKKPKKDPSENYYATLMREATNNTIAATNATEELTKSELKLLEVKADPRFATLNAVQKQDVTGKYEAAVAAEKQAKAVEDVAKAEEFRLKILGKSEGITKEYYGQIKALEEHAVKAGWSREQIEELTRAIFQGTPAWQQYQKALDDVNRSADKFNEMSIRSQAESDQYNKELNYRVDMLGKTSKQQKAITIEYQRANKLREVDIKLSKQLKDINDEINKAKLKGLKPEDYKSLTDAQVQAERDAAEERKGINREVAVQAAEDFDAEFRKIKEGVTDSIVTALFEGGKAGSKKLRDVLVNVLRQKVTMVVDVGVNAFMNSLIGGSTGSLVGGAGSGVLGSIATSLGGSALASSLGISGLFTGGAALATSNAALGVGLGLGSSSAAAAASGAAVAGGTSAGVAGAASSLGTALAAIPGWGWALAGVAALGSMLSKKQTLHSGAGAIYNSDTGVQEGAGIYNLGTFGMGDVREYNKDGQALASGIAAGLGSTLDGIAKAFGQKAGYEVATAFADDTSKDGAWGALRISQGGKDLLNWQDTRTSKWAPKEFADGAEGQAQYLAAIANDTRKVLLDMDLPGWADTILNRLGELSNMDQLSAAVAQIAQAQTAFEAFGQYMPIFAGMADTAISKFVDASGGVGALAGNMSVFVDGFYTDAEKLAVNTQNVTDALAKLGFEMPKTRDEFKALVQSQIALGDGGAKTAAGLLALSGAVSSVLPPFEDAANSVKELSSSVIDEINRLRGYTDTSGNSPQALITEFDRLTTLARGGDANAFNSLGDTSKLLDDYYKNTATSAVQYAYQRSVLANSLEQSYNTAKASGATFSGTSSLMGTPALSAPVVSSVSSANAAGSSGIADLLSAVVTELTMLRAEVRADVAHNAKTAKILERVTPEGDALATRTEG